MYALLMSGLYSTHIVIFRLKFGTDFVVGLARCLPVHGGQGLRRSRFAPWCDLHF